MRKGLLKFWIYLSGTAFVALLEQMVKAKGDIIKLTVDTMQKLSIVGIALGIFQDRTDGIYIAIGLLAASYILTIWRAGQ